MTRCGRNGGDGAAPKGKSRETGVRVVCKCFCFFFPPTPQLIVSLFSSLSYMPSRSESPVIIIIAVSETLRSAYTRAYTPPPPRKTPARHDPTARRREGGGSSENNISFFARRGIALGREKWLYCRAPKSFAE